MKWLILADWLDSQSENQIQPFVKIKSRYLVLITATYFIISFVPIFARWKVEIFPFFSFKLFSKIPQSFEHADVLLNADLENPKLLIHGNSDLTRIQSKFYAAKTAEMVERYFQNPIPENQTFEMDGYSGQIVVLKGNYIKAALADSFEVEIIDKSASHD